MPKKTYRWSQSGGKFNSRESNSSPLSRPVLGFVLIVSTIGNLLLFRAVLDKPHSHEALTNIDLPSSLGNVASEFHRRMKYPKDLLEGVLPWNITTTGSLDNLNPNPNLNPPSWLQSHLQWHLYHLTKTHVDLKSKATRWAIDAEEVAHSMHRTLVNATTNAVPIITTINTWAGGLLNFTDTSTGSSRDQSTMMAGTADSDVIHHHLLRSSGSSNDRQNQKTGTNTNTGNSNTHHSNPSVPPLWDPAVTSTPLPKWLQDYFTWHQDQLKMLTNNENYLHSDTMKFLIMLAPRNGKSGGMTDRVRPFPIFLRIAAETKRLLFIRWERPFPLEEFLLPPKGGCNWTVPSLLLEDPNLSQPLPTPATDLDRIYKMAHDPAQKIITTNYQSWNYGELMYNELLKKDAEKQTEPEPDLWSFFRDVWKIMFRPSPPVEERIRQNLKALQLVPGEFATVHVRALYGIKERDAPGTLKMVTNAMNCVSNLRPGGPYFIASDSLLAIQMAMAYAEYRNVTLVSATHEREPLHIEFYNSSDPTLKPSDFYDGFVDVYIMAATRCVAHGKGGFARWGQLLGYNSSCTHSHNGFKSSSCTWQNGTADAIAKRRGYP